MLGRHWKEQTAPVTDLLQGQSLANEHNVNGTEQLGGGGGGRETDASAGLQIIPLW